jgi:hypothetical protein
MFHVDSAIFQFKDADSGFLYVCFTNAPHSRTKASCVVIVVPWNEISSMLPNLYNWKMFTMYFSRNEFRYRNNLVAWLLDNEA